MSAVQAPLHDLDLFVRAARVRKLITAGLVEPWEGLYCVLWPTEEMREREQAQSPNTRHGIVSRDRRFS